MDEDLLLQYHAVSDHKSAKLRGLQDIYMNGSSGQRPASGMAGTAPHTRGCIINYRIESLEPVEPGFPKEIIESNLITTSVGFP